MKSISSLIRITVLDLVRQKIVFAFGLLSLILFFLSFLLGSMTLDEQQRILTHLGLGAIHLSVIVLATLLGSTLLHREIERQTCLLVLARPISRTEYFFAIWAGSLSLLLFLIISLGLFLFLLLGMALPFKAFALSLGGIILETTVCLSIAFAFSLFIRPALAVFATIGFFLVGHWLEDLSYFAKKSANLAFQLFAEVIQWITPHFYQMNWRSHYLIQNNLIDLNSFFWVTIHALGWSLFLLAVSTFLFRRKDLA